MTTGTSATLGRPTRKYDLQLKRGPPVFFFFPIDDRQWLGPDDTGYLIEQRSIHRHAQLPPSEKRKGAGFGDQSISSLLALVLIAN